MEGYQTLMEVTWSAALQGYQTLREVLFLLVLLLILLLLHHLCSATIMEGSQTLMVET